MNDLIEKISADYDLELNNSKKLSFEACCSLSKKISEYRAKSYFEFYKISKSINRVSRMLSILH